jgi:hypothetical protein
MFNIQNPRPFYLSNKENGIESTRRRVALDNQEVLAPNVLVATNEAVAANRVEDSIPKVPVAASVAIAQGQLLQYDANMRRNSTLTSQVENSSLQFQRYKAGGTTMTDQISMPSLPHFDISNTKMGMALTRNALTNEELASIYEPSSTKYSDQTIATDLLRIEQYRTFILQFYDNEAMFPLKAAVLTSFMRFLGKQVICNLFIFRIQLYIQLFF